MTLKRYFISAAFLLASIRGLCCGPYYYTPQEYYMYRAYDAKDERLKNVESSRNCKAWQESTSEHIPIADISEVVYKYDIDKIRNMMTDAEDSNAFVRWIRKNNDYETQEFLLLAKSCEKVRFMKSSRWYYPSRKDDVVMNLEAIRDKALGYDGKRLSDRYALQALRAMHSLGEYAEIEKWWDENGRQMRPGVIREMAEGYVMGALSRLGNIDKSMQMAAKSNDLGAVKMAMRYRGYATDDKSVLDFIASHCPDNPNAPAFLQEIFYGTENKYKCPVDGEYFIDDPDFGEYLVPCLKAAESAVCKEPSMWYYTAAYIEGLQGNTSAAYRHIKMAENSAGSPFIKESVKLMRIYLDAKVLRYDGSGDALLLADLKWMEHMLCSNITSEVREKTEELFWLHGNYSYYYWGDMMRRVVLGEMVPRMRKAGRGRTAIALANMADNRMLGLVDRLPFVYDPTRSAVPPDYKLSFARQMLRYQKESMSSDPNRAGLAMTMMGIGLRSSFGFCWSLTQYHLYTDDAWVEDHDTKKALSRAEKLIEDGRNMIIDRELSARICVMLCQWGRAVKHYPETKAADMIRTYCDTYKDHQI